MRIIAVFKKDERIRHIGHLDIQRAVQRGLRRSGLPVAYSSGFNPHILVTFASALSTGAWGEREIMDVKMAEEVTPDTFLRAMNKAMPPELRLLEARRVEDKFPAMMASLRAAAWDIAFRDQKDAEKMLSVLASMMQKENIPALRKTKTGLRECDIRPLIYSVRGENPHLFATLALTEGEACKPVMLLEALRREAKLPDEQEIRVLIGRKALYGEENGRLIPLEHLGEAGEESGKTPGDRREPRKDGLGIQADGRERLKDGLGIQLDGLGIQADGREIKQKA